MKKTIIFLLAISFGAVSSSCVQNNYDLSYMNEVGYKEYVSDKDTGEITSFCGTLPSIEVNKKALKYYKKNKRECNGFLVTNYEDGICINRVLNPDSWDWVIPETLEGLPVVKLGCYLKKNNDVEPFFINDSIPLSEEDPGDNYYGRPVHLPKTIKYIDDHCLVSEITHISYAMDSENQYYFSDSNNNLYAIENEENHLAIIYLPYYV